MDEALLGRLIMAVASDGEKRVLVQKQGESNIIHSTSLKHWEETGWAQVAKASLETSLIGIDARVMVILTH